MTTGRRHSDYDPFAWFYNRYWGERFAEQVLPVLDRLVFPLWPAGGRILDLCCGTGQLAHALATRGFRVTGIDGSVAMLRHARENAPGAEFILADARSFTSPAGYDGVLSTFDSLNHVMSLPELTATFRNVHAALVEHGAFLFDLNMEEGYRARWRGTASIVEDDDVCIVLPGYDPKERIGRYDITLFELKAGGWQRSDLTLLQRCYSEAEVRSALGQAGFGEVSTYDAENDLGMPRNVGRTFFLARK
jgi:SAM-dependent methyltransferase